MKQLSFVMAIQLYFNVREKYQQHAHIFSFIYSNESILYMNLTFRGPCIVICFYNKSQRDALFLNFHPNLASRQST
jgi:hypothetical protein